MKASVVLFWICLMAPMDRSVFRNAEVLEVWLAECHLDCLLLLTAVGAWSLEVCCCRLDYRLDCLLDCLLLGAVLLLTHWTPVTLLLGMDYFPIPVTVPPPGLFGGTTSSCRLGSRMQWCPFPGVGGCSGNGMTCGTGVGGGGGGGGAICRDGMLPGDLPNPGGPRPSVTPPGALTTIREAIITVSYLIFQN